MTEKEINSGSTAAIMRKYDIRPVKKFGQNFLTDGCVLRRIAEASGVTKEDAVLEIGPGIGNLTRILSERAGRVFAVEIDKKLIPVLGEVMSSNGNVTIINGDILKTDISGLSTSENGGKPFKVVANLPYYITTPIIMSLLESKAHIESLTIMIQKEVAERMISPPGKKSYGALTLAVRYYAEAECIMDVPPTAFIPNPAVYSSIMHLRVRKTPPVTVKNEKLLFDIIRASFNQRRKTLQNALKNAPGLFFSGEEIGASIEKLGKGAHVRGEQLSLEEFAALSEILNSYSESL